MQTQTASAFDNLGLPPLLVWPIPFFVTIVGTPIARDIALRLGLVDAPIAGSSKTHEKPIPYLGGLPLFAALATGTVIILHQTGAVLPGISPALLIGAISFIFAVGLSDDVLGMNPHVKMFMLAVAGTALFFGGGRVTFIPDSWGIAGQVISWGLTLFWILGITNSANLMDNMNGLAAGMGIVAGLSLLAIATIGGDPVGIGLSLILVGALLGYIPYNYPSAQIFSATRGASRSDFFCASRG